MDWHDILDKALCCALVALAVYMVSLLVDSDIKEREEQRAACIAKGGKYAESERLNPARDFCIKG